MHTKKNNKLNQEEMLTFIKDILDEILELLQREISDRKVEEICNEIDDIVLEIDVILRNNMKGDIKKIITGLQNCFDLLKRYHDSHLIVVLKEYEYDLLTNKLKVFEEGIDELIDML